LISLIENATMSIEETMDGTSGALYAIFFNALTQYVKAERPESAAVSNPKFWGQALQSAVVTLSKYTPAQVGDRTLMDALLPFINQLRKTGNVQEAAQASMNGAENTKHMKATLGRIVYVGGENEWRGQIPDPGAWGLCKFFEGLARSVRQS
jgi:dihydroxyacetone kinase